MSYSTVRKALERQHADEVRQAGIERLKRMRGAIAERQDAAEHVPVRPHDTAEQIEHLDEARRRAAEQAKEQGA